MIYLLAGFVVLALLLYGTQSFIKANPADLARQIKTAFGMFLLALAAICALTGRFAFAIGLAGFGFTVLGLRNGGPGHRSPGQASRVRAAMVEMELDHDTGAMRGMVLAGRFEGRALDDLSPEDLKALWLETGADGQSQALVEAYLDRRLAGWREDFEANGANGHGGTASTGPMTDEEAYQILGLSPGAGEAEIRSAHRRLMKRLHPDHGGTSFLAAKLNEAKDTLLRRH